MSRAARLRAALADRVPRGDEGSAVVEFVTVGVLMLVPVVYLVVAVAGVQAAAFATESAAREAARIVVTTTDEGLSEDRVVAAVGWALRDQGIDADPARAATVVCAARPCLTPGADVAVTVRVEVPLPALPAGVSRVVPLVVPVSATHTQVVGEFEGSVVSGGAAAGGSAADGSGADGSGDDGPDEGGRP
ncbi:pilus assembly protein [Aquipuribacter hungaricus]|uniref:Pilus assembly protein n=1 Tax=Aquipuribacter hungaricus TaxID=545624 RepID=A0ABV7WIR5_9MICO